MNMEKEESRRLPCVAIVHNVYKPCVSDVLPHVSTCIPQIMLKLY